MGSLSTCTGTRDSSDVAPSANAGVYQVVHGWPRLPDGYIMGHVTGVDIGSHNRVFVFHRADRFERMSEPVARTTLLCIDGASGETLWSWGDGLFLLPHGLTIDHEDNIWVTDCGHRLMKFSPGGELLLTIGDAEVSGCDERHFYWPTAIAVAPSGDFYVADGYGNSRVAKFAADGSFLFDWGIKGSEPGQFDTPHGITLDAAGHVYVADRGNARIQIFDPNGTFLGQWKNRDICRPWGVYFGPDGYFYVADGGEYEPDLKRSSQVVKLDGDGKTVSRWGSYGRYDGQFVWAHDLAVGHDGGVYVGDILGMRVQKFVQCER
jgi:peptidylamidoglycolate lyase